MKRNHFFCTRSGNLMIVAMDHGIALGSPEGFRNPRATLKKVLEGDPDGILAGRNFVREFHGELMAKSGLRIVVTVDFLAFSTIPGKKGELEIQNCLYDVDDVVGLNAHAVKTFLIFGREDSAVFEKNVRYVADLSKKTDHYGMPLMVEPVLWGKKIDEADKTNSRLIEHACRIAFELGADIIKAPYPSDYNTFAKIVDNSPIPILILGGPKMDTTEKVLQTVKEAMDAGGRGVVFGRNIWQHRSPSKMIKAIKSIIHENCSVKEAHEFLSREEEK